MDPWVRKMPWRRDWQSPPIFLPGEFHGQKSLVDYSSRSHKETDTTEWLILWFSCSLFSSLIWRWTDVFFLNHRGWFIVVEANGAGISIGGAQLDSFCRPREYLPITFISTVYMILREMESKDMWKADGPSHSEWWRITYPQSLWIETQLFRTLKGRVCIWKTKLQRIQVYLTNPITRILSWLKKYLYDVHHCRDVWNTIYEII